MAASLAALSMAFTTAIGAEEEIPPPEATGGVDLRDPQVIAKGLETLGSTCGGYCHGSMGSGYKGPALRNRPDLTPKGMFATISYGRKRAGKQMPAWKGTLSDQEIWTVIAAVVSLRHADPDATQEKAGGH